MERFVTIFFPLRARSVCTLPVAKRVIAAILVLFTLYEAHAFFTIGFDNTPERLACTALSPAYLRFYEVMDSIFYSYIPLTVMFTCNVGIIVKLLWSKFGEKESKTGNTLSKAATGITVMLVSVCALFIACTLPYAVLYQVNIDVSTYSYAAIILLMYSNHTFNIIVYSLTNSQFKRELLRVFCRSKDNQVHSTTEGSTQPTQAAKPEEENKEGN